MTSQARKILLVDDEPDILEFIRYNLEKEGYEVAVASNGREAIAKAVAVKPSLIILDVMMPGMDGIETCHELRRTPGLGDTLITFLTARGEDYSQIAGLDSGADDYITKPIKPRVLISRVNALLRRQDRPQEAEIIFIAGDLTVDRAGHIVKLGGKAIDLPRKEFELLALLSSRPGRVFSREDILAAVWGNEVVVGDRTIDVHIRRLREKIGEDFIKTVKGVGYKLDF